MNFINPIYTLNATSLAMPRGMARSTSKEKKIQLKNDILLKVFANPRNMFLLFYSYFVLNATLGLVKVSQKDNHCLQEKLEWIHDELL